MDLLGRKKRPILLPFTFANNGFVVGFVVVVTRASHHEVLTTLHLTETPRESHSHFNTHDPVRAICHTSNDFIAAVREMFDQ